MMKLLLTSSGISNPSIHGALLDLLGKPIAESNALFIPTAIFPFHAVPVWHTRPSAEKPHPPCANWAGSRWECWSSTALSSIEKKNWVSSIEETDALLVWGGDPL